MNVTLHIDAISVSTRELYDNFFECAKDVMWDRFGENAQMANALDESPEEFIKIMRGLAVGNANEIRKAFVDGYTVMMMGGKMERLELMQEKEVRVYHDGKLVCVLVDSEIQY